MDLDDLLDFSLIVLIAYKAYKLAKHAKKRKTRRIWIRELNTNRKIDGFFEKSFSELKSRDPEQFQRCTRMNRDIFDALFNLLEEELTKYSWREPISAKCRLFLTLLYLSQGVSRQYLAMTFKMGVSTIREIALETCEVIWNSLSNVYLSPPNKYEWQTIETDFRNIWNMPNCVGAVDGKHIQITCPSNSGSQYYNYKGTYSIVLLGVCDANYTFTAVDIGAYGSQSDGGIFAYSAYGKALLNNRLDLPADNLLPNSDMVFPHYFVGDAAFPLKKCLMRPYPGRCLDEKKENFNKRLSRARRTIENTFGILTARWRILRNTMNMSPEAAEKIVKAAVVLHNFVKMHDSSYCPPDYVDRYDGDQIIEGLWRKEVVPLRRSRRIGANNAAKNAFRLRDDLCEYLFRNKI